MAGIQTLLLYTRTNVANIKKKKRGGAVEHYSLRRVLPLLLVTMCIRV